LIHTAHGSGTRVEPGPSAANSARVREPPQSEPAAPFPGRAAPLKPLPVPVDLDRYYVRRQARTAGLINGYRLVALRGRGFRHAQCQAAVRKYGARIFVASAASNALSTACRAGGLGHDDETGARSLSRSGRLPEQTEHEKSCSADASAAANAGCRSPRSMRTWARFSRARSAFTNGIWLIADTQAAMAAGRDKPRRSGLTARPSGSSSPPSSNSMTPLQSRLQPCLD
jgi:hypothetical protein